MAQNPETIPIRATVLFPSNGLSKSTFVKLNMIKAKDNTITM